MGAWSVALYGSDTALDVRGDFEVWARIPGAADDLVRALCAKRPHTTDEADEDYPDFWLALADQLHVHGMEHAETFRRAQDIITSGHDIKSKVALGLEPSDVAKRAQVLAELQLRWASPHPRPKKRKVLKAPEPHAFPADTIVVYPTCGGEARNYADVKNRLGWFQDGWGSGIILATGHEHGWFGWAAAGRLSIHGRDRPTFEQCRAASIESQPWAMNTSGNGTIAIQVGALAPAHAQRMGFEALGHVPLDAGKVAALHQALREPRRVPAATLFQVWTWWADGVEPMREKRDPGIANPKPVAALETLIA